MIACPLSRVRSEAGDVGHVDMLGLLIAKMRSDPAAPFHTASASTSFGLSPFVFIRAFKRLTGLSPQRFHAALRIALAKQLLVETDRSVTDVSLDAGYNSLGTFVRTFTALVGVSPSQLRRLSRGEANVIDEVVPPVRPSRKECRLHASIEMPLPSGSLVAAGLFPQGLPAGLPFDGCFVDPAAPSFHLAWPPGRRRASLLAAAIGSFEPRAAWAGHLGEVAVGHRIVSGAEQGSALASLHLRPLAETDPPFLTPVPLLMLLQSGRSAVA